MILSLMTMMIISIYTTAQCISTYPCLHHHFSPSKSINHHHHHVYSIHVYSSFYHLSIHVYSASSSLHPFYYSSSSLSNHVYSLLPLPILFHRLSQLMSIFHHLSYLPLPILHHHLPSPIH